jgi:hypothetical protein
MHSYRTPRLYLNTANDPAKQRTPGQPEVDYTTEIARRAGVRLSDWMCHVHS